MVYIFKIDKFSPKSHDSRLQTITLNVMLMPVQDLQTRTNTHTHHTQYAHYASGMHANVMRRPLEAGSGHQHPESSHVPLLMLLLAVCAESMSLLAANCRCRLRFFDHCADADHLHQSASVTTLLW